MQVTAYSLQLRCGRPALVIEEIEVIAIVFNVTDYLVILGELVFAELLYLLAAVHRGFTSIAVGHDELLGHGLDREWEAPELFETVREIMKSKTCDEWVAWFDQPENANMCAAKVNTKTEAVAQLCEENPEALAYVEFPRVGKVLQTGLPHHLSNIPTPISEYKAVSDLGEDTEAEHLEVKWADNGVWRQTSDYQVDSWLCMILDPNNSENNTGATGSYLFANNSYQLAGPITFVKK